MLRLPKATELSKQLPKNAIYAKFQMNTAEKAKIDADISRITIVNEVSADKVHIAAGEQVKFFFVLLVALKKKDFNDKTITTISKLIPQNMLLVLECGDEAKLATYHTKLMQTEWKQKEELSIDLKGLNLDAVWENIIIQIGGITVDQGNTLDEQIAVDEQRRKIQKEIDRLTKAARNEKQPKKRFELAQKANVLKKQLAELGKKIKEGTEDNK